MKVVALTAAAILGALPTRALAWGYEGHQVVADIARPLLVPAVRARVDALLASDPDTLTAHDMASEATWADAFRGAGHRETAQWHFVDIELAAPDLPQACFGFPASPSASASTGPANDCVVDKIEEFSAELHDPNTPEAERRLALKFLLHFVGDLHQPLHASDNHDRGGNCVLVSLGGSRTVNLHSLWDTGVVQGLGSDPAALAVKLSARITPSDRAAWEKGDPRSWAKEGFDLARTVAYSIHSPPGCVSDTVPITLPASYLQKAEETAALQLAKAGVRLAALLNRQLR